MGGNESSVIVCVPYFRRNGVLHTLVCAVPVHDVCVCVCVCVTMHCAPNKDMNCVVCDNEIYAFDPLQNNHSSRSVICSFELLNHFLRIVL